MRENLSRNVGVVVLTTIVIVAYALGYILRYPAEAEIGSRTASAPLGASSFRQR